MNQVERSKDSVKTFFVLNFVLNKHSKTIKTSCSFSQLTYIVLTIIFQLDSLSATMSAIVLNNWSDRSVSISICDYIYIYELLL